MSMVILCIALLLMKISRRDLCYIECGFFKSGEMWSVWGTWCILRGWIKIQAIIGILEN